VISILFQKNLTYECPVYPKVHPKLRYYGYEIIHFESPDYRGIDLGLLYRKDFFFIDHVKKHTLNLLDPKTQHRRTTRDQLVITGYWEGHALASLAFEKRRAKEK
jgi:hypothetical protein